MLYFTNSRQNIPPHHQSQAFDVGQVQWLGIRLISATIRRLERLPRQLNVARLLCHKLGLPADGARLPAVLARRPKLVFERHDKAFAVGFVWPRDADEDAIIAGQIERQLVAAMLGGEACAAERGCVEMAVEACLGLVGVRDGEIRLT